MHNQPTQQEGAEQSQETAYVKPSEHEGKFGIGDKMTFYVDGKPIEAEVVQTEDVDGVVVQTSERVNGHLINQYTREELDALTTPPQQANDNADVARPQAPEAGTEVQNETEEEKSPDELPAFDGDKFNETHPVDEIRQPQEEQKPNEGNNAVDEASTASKIPQGEDGEYDYMQAEPSKAWAALLEQTDGDADMAREVAQSMLDDKVAELEEAQKQQPKEGKSVAEKIAARKEHKANIERIESEIERWRQIIQSGEDRQAGEKSRIDEADETPAVDTKSESGVDGEVKSEDMLQPIGKGVFGNIYDQFKGKVKEAFDFLTKHKSGDLLGVFHRDGFGDIDLVWGDNGGGLAHIIQRHVEEQNDFNSVEEVRDVIDDVIKNGSINEKKSKWDKVVFEKDGYSVVVSRNLRDKDGNIIEQNKDWVVTAFDNSRGRNSKKRESSSDVTQVTPNTNKGGRAVAPNDNSSESKDTKSKAEGQEKSEESKETSLSEQISTASAEMNTNPTDAQKPNDGSKKKEDSGASENGEGKEEVKPQEELKPKKPKNEKGEESKADGEKGKGEKIEDVGEKIEGARKDALKKLAESMEQATEEALVAMPFSKAFKRPNLKKAVEDGVLRAEDALFAQAVMSAYLSRKKPLMSKSRSNYERERSEKTIKVWAHHAYNGVEKLKKLFSLSPSERDTFMREEMNRPAYDPKDVEKRKQDLMEWNPGKVFNGTCYPINAIRLWNDVCTQLGYEVGTEVPQLFSEVLPTTGYDSYVLVAANGTKFYPARSLNSYNAVVDEIVYQTKVANADADTDHPKETFEVKGSGEMKTKSSGKWYVVTQASLSAKPHKDIFSSKEEAEKFAEAYMKNDGKKVDKYRYASEPKEVKVFDGYGEYAVVLRRKNIGKGTTTDFELKYYNTEAEARVAIDAEHDELNELANKELAKDKGSKSASTKKPICSIEVYTKDGKSWKYGIVLSDKYAPKKSALNTMPYYLAKDFNTRKEAQAYLDAHKEEIEAKAAKVDEARRNFKYFTANGERVGTDYRHGEDVSADQFREQFGFRGVQFGNWTNQRDRQEAINQAFDAFMDLSRLLGVSPRALSLNGELGVAFGARGSGKALAHYEPKEVVINLTKTSGAGSLAHEWWHALDNYFARQGNVAMGFVTQSKNIEMRDELRQAFNTLIDHLEKSPYNQRSKQRGSSYWGTPIEETARMFEQWVNDQLAERGEKSPFLIDADPYIEERYAQMNYEMYKFFMGDKAMPYEEYKQTPQALNGLVYLTRDELQTFGKDLKHIFDTIQQKVDETTGKTLMYHKGGVAVSLNSEEVALRDAVIDRLRENGIDVVTDVSEGQRVLDMANGKERLSGKQKRALETASVSQNEKHQPTVVSSADGAKVLKELDKTKDKYENQSNRSKTFIGDVAKALGARRHGSSSEYATFETKNGKIVTIRLSSHNAKVSNFDNNEEADGISIVVSARQSNGIDNDGNAHITEFYYNAIKLRRADGKPLSEIVRSIKQALYSGEFKDTTGIAERQEVNGDVVREHRVYHGSGADFDSFDHSHMGEGEGAQAYGWGTYVTEVEGIGRTYAISNTTKRNDALRALEHDIDAISGQLDMHRNGLKNDEEQLKRANDWRAEAELDYELFQEKAEERKKEYGEDSPEYRNLLFNDIYTDEMKRAQRSVESTEDSIRYRKEKIAELEKALNDKKAEMNELPEKFPRHLYSVEIPEDNGKNYLDWNERLSDSQIEAIRAYLSDNYRRNKLEDFDASIAEIKDAPNADEVNAWARRGENVYKTLSHLLGSDDAASKALSEMGFAGIKYPAENRSGGRKDGAKNYVIFNENDAKIVDKVRFFRTADSEAYGFVVGGKIYIDPRIASSETSVHEYAHLWAEALRSANAKEWSNVVGLMRGTSVWNEVMERYPELKSDDEIADEVLATYSGRRGSERLREEMDRIKGSERSVADKARALGALERVKRALDRFWHGVADFLGIHYGSADEVADRVMRDLLSGVDPRRFVKGESDGRVREQFVGEMGAERAVELGRELGSDVDVVSDVSEITDANPEVQERKRRAKGWYDAKTGRVVINLAAHSDMADVEQTLLHEIVGHRGLRGLVGHENFNGFLDGIYEHASDVVREGIDDIARRKGCSKRVATEEYMSGLAEGGFADRKNAGLWQQIRQWFGDMLSRAKIKLNFSISDNELRYLLWRSHELSRMNGREGVVGRARDLAMQNRLGVGNVARRGGERVVDSYDGDLETLFRDADSPVDYERALIRDSYERRLKDVWFQSREALQDGMLSLKETMKDIWRSAGKKFSQITDIPDYANPYIGQNRLSSRNAAEVRDFKHNLFRPLLREVGRLTGFSADGRAKLTDYMMAKHGLERNKVMAERDAKAAYEAEKLKDPNTTKTLKDFVAEFRKKDYSGLTSLTGLDDVAAAEAEAKNMVADYEANHDTANLWARTKAVTDAIVQKQYDSGYINSITRNAILNMYDNYIPLRGFEDKTAEDVYSYMKHSNSAFNAPIKTARGRKSKADDPFANMLAMAESGIMRGNRNKLVKLPLLSLVLEHPTDLISVSDVWLKYNDALGEWEVVNSGDVNGTKAIDVNDTPEEVESKMVTFNGMMTALAAHEPDRYRRQADFPDIPYRVINKSSFKEHQIVITRNGRDYVLTINGNPHLAQVINGLANPDVKEDIATKVTRYLSKVYTQLSVDFAVANCIRDTIYSNTSAWVRGGRNYGLAFTTHFAVNVPRMYKLYYKHLRGTLNENNRAERLFKEFMSNGGETGYHVLPDMGQRKSDIDKELKRLKGKVSVKKAFGWLVDAIDYFNKVLENTARFTAYQTSRQFGRTVGQSINNAKEISVNFNTKGAGTAFMNSKDQKGVAKVVGYIAKYGRNYIPFFNAAIQGTTNRLSQIKHHKVAGTAQIAGMTGLGFAMGLLGFGGDDDDDKYANIPDFVRRNNITFKVGSKTYITIPLPVEDRIAYGLGELAASIVTKGERLSSEEASYQVASLFSQLMPVDFTEGGSPLTKFVPGALKPIAEVALNQSWTGMPIYKDNIFNENVPEYLSVYSNTSKPLVEISKYLNELGGGDPHTRSIEINPAAVEYLLSAYFGGLYNLGNMALKTGETIAGTREFNPSSIPVLNRLVKSPDDRTEYRQINNEFYKIGKEAEKLDKRLNSYKNDTRYGIADYADKIRTINYSPEYRYMLIYQAVEPHINKLEKKLKDNTLTDSGRKEVESSIQGLKKLVVERVRREQDNPTSKPITGPMLDSKFKNEWVGKRPESKEIFDEIAKTERGVGNELGGEYQKRANDKDRQLDIQLQRLNDRLTDEQRKGERVVDARKEYNKSVRSFNELIDNSDATSKDFEDAMQSIRTDRLEYIKALVRAKTSGKR